MRIERVRLLLENAYKEPLGSEEVSELVDFALGGEEGDDDDTKALRFSVAFGVYQYCVDYHGGQGSAEYAALCRLTEPGMFDPGQGFHGLDPNNEEDVDACEIYRACGGQFDEDERDEDGYRRAE